jgi:iron complex transport system ATP-binding protein
MELMLRVDNISFSYKDERVLKGIKLAVQRGEFACLLGSNGSGKTTILKCINGILRPLKGRIFIDNRELSILRVKDIAKHISMVPQEHTAIFSYMSIDLVTMGITPYLSFASMPDKEIYYRAEEVLKELGIIELAYRNYNELSGGERQLVLIARALMQDTELLILDEPTAHLDFKNQYYLMSAVRNLTRGGKTVITALHDPNLALRFCNKVILIKNGSVLTQGNTDEVMNDNNLKKTYDMDVSIRNVIEGQRFVIPN